MQSAPVLTRAERRRAAKLAKKAEKAGRKAPRPREQNAAAEASARLCALNYRADLDAAALRDEHLAWAERFAKPLYPSKPPALHDADPERPLRIGYLSGDLRRHPVALFVEPLLRRHDRGAFRPFCYATREAADDLNAHLRGLVSDWRDVGADSDGEIAGRIAADKIDILVDLSGHTPHNRLLVFARRPAPIQVTAIGYVATTGLATMDYRLTDPWCDPPGDGDTHYSESLWRLPSGFNCYAPPAGLLGPGPLPAARNGHVTFGCFNNLDKIGPDVLALWGETVAALPDARLLLKTKSLGQTVVRQRVLAGLAAGGLEPARVALIDWSPSLREHFAYYDQVDIALDPFPYNGTTTTCEALMMGVPVIALIGDRHAGRVSFSLLSRLGLPELAAPNAAGYRDTALALARDIDRLAALRAGLRQRLAASPLVDAAGYARSVEAAFRKMWRRRVAATPEGTLGFEGGVTGPVS